MGNFYKVHIDGTETDHGSYKVGCSRDNGELRRRKDTYKLRDVGGSFTSWPVRCYLAFESEVKMTLVSKGIPLVSGTEFFDYQMHEQCDLEVDRLLRSSAVGPNDNHTKTEVGVHPKAPVLWHKDCMGIMLTLIHMSCPVRLNISVLKCL